MLQSAEARLTATIDTLGVVRTNSNAKALAAKRNGIKRGFVAGVLIIPAVKVVRYAIELFK